MKTNFDISLKVYEILNVSAVTTLLDGKVYRDGRRLYKSGEELQRDIEIAPLTIDADFIQKGAVMVNIYAPDLSNGSPDIATLQEISNAVISEVESYIQDPLQDYFDLEIIAPGGIMKDKQGESYNNIRIIFYILKS